ncbi:MAG: archease [Oscillatoria princeps RMCB-10]|jgi:SHS2 domain-containing protein|nr:archease [Oscillatoria princeps RMCB-10]
MKNSGFFKEAGFEEIDHTADWAYRIWGPNLEELFIQGALGLFALAGADLEPEPVVVRELQLRGVDSESLLVAWLNELLYLQESEGLGFNQFDIGHLDRHSLHVRVTGAPVRSWLKFIKAVTYHDLSIRTGEAGLEATLVIDV